ncbi:hypothetical protein DL240_09025 [Lujinxingia litoralis]|uniref:TIGR04255 family protein n=1 Tax=Lujinxingia litoralis TaxID=2211119 RepID=A0A328C8M1_9DELT|nr:TIGR04255 family protein [Lujinxingia litoralis]RAL23020.1 hypothetical protein DL240_09025 [Lujinxingia litoralis]
MPIPASERIIFEPNPLVEVSCELSIERLLRLESELPVALQEAIRDRYPRQESSRDASRGLTTYDFISEDRFWKFSVNATHLRLATTEYTERQDFHRRLSPLLKAFSSIYDVHTASGFSLTYQDVINRHELGLNQSSYAELLKPAFAGELCDDALEEDEVDELMRFISLKLAQGRAHITHGLTRDEQNRRVYVIRTELFEQGRYPFEQIPQILLPYHDQGGYIFRWAISDRLKEALTSGAHHGICPPDVAGNHPS